MLVSMQYPRLQLVIPLFDACSLSRHLRVIFSTATRWKSGLLLIIEHCCRLLEFIVSVKRHIVYETGFKAHFSTPLGVCWSISKHFLDRDSMPTAFKVRLSEIFLHSSWPDGLELFVLLK